MKPAPVALAVTALLLGGCLSSPVRTQSLYFMLHHAALFADPNGRGRYILELRSVRKVTELSVVRISFERPGMKPYTRDITVRAGQRRFVVHTPPLDGFEAGEPYLISVELLSPDRFQRLDNLRHRVTPTLPGGG